LRPSLSLVLLAVAACGGATSATGGADDAGAGDDAAGFVGPGGAACGALGDACCTVVTQARPVIARELRSAQAVACNQGLACVMGVCQPPSVGDAGGDASDDAGGGPPADAASDARTTGDAGTGTTVGAHPSSTLAVGGDHACVVRGGQVECWGSNYAGELGVGDASGPQSCSGGPCTPTPVAVTGLSAPVAVAAAYSETCALLSGGAVACWGANQVGQLGDGNSSGPELCTDQLPCSTTPVLVSGVSDATSVATNGGFSCAVLSSGVVKCWGTDEEGPDGPDASGSYGGTVATTVSGLPPAAEVSVGTLNYACVLLLDGTVQCWGSNPYGQLGNGSVTNATDPAPVLGITGATAIAAGWDHACALLAGGTVACWGDDGDGELGLGTAASSQPCGDPCATTPVKVPNLSGVTAIAAGLEDTCALLSDGTVRCWGFNADGQLGDGTTTNSPTPVAVTGLTGATAIAMSEEQACALLASGGVVCWGRNDSDQLGSTVAGPAACSPCSTTPQAVSGL
jgi:alpha-tubulin suppressor-like RCC1 family protein